jgi:hypothetical protein
VAHYCTYRLKEAADVSAFDLAFHISHPLQNLHAHHKFCERRGPSFKRRPAQRTQEVLKMLELRLELQPFYDDREPKNARRVQRSSSTARNEGWSSKSSYGNQWEAALDSPTVPRRGGALEEDTFEFASSRVREFEF